jgi:hypothetical protein
MTTMLLLHFNEPDGVRPVDSMRNLDDLAGAVPLAASWTGDTIGGRDFTAAAFLSASDLAGRDTLTTRDATVQAIVSVRRASLVQGELVRRGVGGSAAERCALGLEVLPGPGSLLYLRWFWETEAGALKTQAPGVYEHPGDSEFVLLTATRRWESSSRVVIRYYVGEEMVGEIVSADGDIGGATTGTTRVGSGFHGLIDELKVTDHEMAHEEVRETWRRLTVHQPAGEDVFRGQIPIGPGWARDPSNLIGRRVRVAGQALGLAVASAERMRATWLPHRADAETLAEWERIRGIAPKPLDSLDVRRARVVALFQREAGYSRPAVQQALADPFDLAAADVQILEFTNAVHDTFEAVKTERWHLESSSQWTSLVGTQLRVQVASAADIRWEAAARIPCHARMSLASNAGAFSAQVTISGIANLTTDAIVGLFLYNYRTGDALWFGVRNDGGTYRLMRRSYIAGVVSDVVMHSYGALPAPLWLRAIASSTTPGTYSLQHSLVSADDLATVAVVAGLVANPEYAGLAAVGLDASTATTTDVRFDDFVARTPAGTRPFHWYAYRDPLLAGEEDMRGANLIVEKLKPAHTHAAAISSRSLLCDDDGSLCDHGPMGAL